MKMCSVLQKNLRFIKKHEPSRLLSSLGIRTPLGKFSTLGDI